MDSVVYYTALASGIAVGELLTGKLRLSWKEKSRDYFGGFFALTVVGHLSPVILSETWLDQLVYHAYWLALVPILIGEIKNRFLQRHVQP